MQYIIGEVQESNRRIYDSIWEFMSDYDMEWQEENWCYLANLVGTENLPKDMPVHEFLEHLMEAEPDVEQGVVLIQFSVSSREHNYREWLDAIAGVPGHSIVEVKRQGESGGRGGQYTCYLCTFPVYPEL